MAGRLKKEAYTGPTAAEIRKRAGILIQSGMMRKAVWDQLRTEFPEAPDALLTTVVYGPSFGGQKQEGVQFKNIVREELLNYRFEKLMEAEAKPCAECGRTFFHDEKCSKFGTNEAATPEGDKKGCPKCGSTGSWDGSTCHYCGYKADWIKGEAVGGNWKKGSRPQSGDEGEFSDDNYGPPVQSNCPSCGNKWAVHLGDEGKMKMMGCLQCGKTYIKDAGVKTEDYDDEGDNDFRNPGGRSALRSGKRTYPCPTCGTKNALTAKDKSLGYQCDRCADRDEGGMGGYGEGVTKEGSTMDSRYKKGLGAQSRRVDKAIGKSLEGGEETSLKARLDAHDWKPGERDAVRKAGKAARTPVTKESTGSPAGDEAISACKYYKAHGRWPMGLSQRAWDWLESKFAGSWKDFVQTPQFAALASLKEATPGGKYVVGGKKTFSSLEDATKYANDLFKRTGVVASVEKKEVTKEAGNETPGEKPMRSWDMSKYKPIKSKCPSCGHRWAVDLGQSPPVHTCLNCDKEFSPSDSTKEATDPWDRTFKNVTGRALGQKGPDRSWKGETPAAQGEKAAKADAIISKMTDPELGQALRDYSDDKTSIWFKQLLAHAKQRKVSADKFPKSWGEGKELKKLREMIRAEVQGVVKEARSNQEPWKNSQSKERCADCGEWGVTTGHQDCQFPGQSGAQNESAPKGWEGTVKSMKKHKDISNPWALAWSMKNKGYKSHKK